MLDEANDLYASVASIWEIRLKLHMGKLRLPTEPEYLESNLRKLGIKAYLLPRIRNDPFDRMLIAQAMVEGMTLVFKDRVMTEYGNSILW